MSWAKERITAPGVSNASKMSQSNVGCRLGSYSSVKENGAVYEGPYRTKIEGFISTLCDP